ncbi:LysR family transcriptional regulator [Rhodobacteraceae bacterium NNCM2]|nr:LysR family transcriptional regulator [Coraliihabitans acroporae]
MEDPDILGLDGHQLQLFLAIDQSGSLSAAARMLDMNQSTVSYHLDHLRKRLGDPLFVRVGNGVKPTERARALLPIVRDILRAFADMAEKDSYDPAQDRGVLRIAGTSIDRDLVVAPVVRHAVRAAPGLSIEMVSLDSFHKEAERLIAGGVDCAIIPESSQEVDGLMRRPLVTLFDAVFFDPAFPLAEGDLDAFCARPQARVAFGAEPGFGVDRRLARLGRTRHVALQVPSFDSALRMIPGTPIIATLPGALAQTAPDLACVAPPWQVAPLRLMLYWHRRTQNSARHAFWRDRLARAGREQMARFS